MVDRVRRAARLAVAIVAGLGLILLGVPVIERSFIYYPTRGVAATPGDVGLDFEEVVFRARDGTRLHGWFVPAEGDRTLLWFHGNAGNISDRVDPLRELHDELDANIFLVSLRGYGRSEGRPHEQGTYLDARAALDALRRRDDIDPGRVVYYGQSLGAAIAVHLATDQPPAALVLEAAFTSVPDMARHHYRLPLGFLIRTRYDTLSKIADVGAPLLLLHGTDDEVVPFTMSERLYEAAREPKRLHRVEGARHNDVSLVDATGYYGQVRAFLEEGVP